MADVKEDIDLTMDDDKKPEVEAEIVVEHDEKPAEKPLKGEKAEPTADDVAAQLREQVEREKKDRIAAENRAREAENRANNASKDVQETNIRLVDAAISAKTQERAALKQQYRDALANADYEAASDINDKIADVVADIKAMETGKEAMKNAPKQVERRSAVDDFIEGVRQSGSPRSAEWLKARPQYVTDARLHQKMIAAHNIAMADGILPDTDEYFAAVEQVLGIKPAPEARRAAPAPVDQEEDDATAEAAKAIGGRKASDSAPPAAPPSRQAPTNGGNRTNVVRLTAQEREIASDLGMTEQEYARNKLALKREGRMH